MNFESLPPLSLYIHIPWCVRKCPYCDFNSHEGNPDEEAYVSALTRDIENFLPEIWGRRVASVFFGGGTPSLMSPRSIERIMADMRARLRLDPEAEVTLEANPGTFEYEKFAAFRDAGINRLSIGIQSFNDRHLAALGRIHDGRQACVAVEMALKHFGNVNLDLMYALPGQSIEEAKMDFSRAIAFDPPHISAYHLTIEPNTLFHKHPPAVPDEDAAFEMQDRVEEALASYEHYETSAFARAGMHCRHNCNYWEYGDYIGIGAGAHSKITLPGGRIRRQVRSKHPRDYIEKMLSGSAVGEGEDVAVEDIPFEFMMNALRLSRGFPLRLFEERTGLSRMVILPQLDRAERMGFISRDHMRVVPTLHGRRFLNELLQIFLPS